MKLLTVAIKDLKQFARNVPGLAMSLAAPLVLTGIMGFAFGGLGGSGTPRLQVTTMCVANLDRGQECSALNLGQELVRVLQGPSWNEMVRVTLVGDAASARQAVDRREAEVALIIPPDLTAALTSQPGLTAQLILYHDPARTTRPAIVAGAITGVLDRFSGGSIAGQVTAQQLLARGAPVSVATQAGGRAALEYVGEEGDASLITVRSGTATRAQDEGLGAILGRVNAGMLVFFLFFTAGTAAQSLLREEQQRTLSRLFTTSTPRATILGGKFVAVFAIVVVQAAILVIAGAVLFGARWGSVAGVIVQIVACAVAASGLGLLLISLSRDVQQAGYLMGLVLSVLGMAGGMFTTGFANLPKIVGTISLLTPHGWAMKGWDALLAGQGVTAVLGPAAVCVASGLVLFAAATMVCRRRFAA